MLGKYNAASTIGKKHVFCFLVAVFFVLLCIVVHKSQYYRSVFDFSYIWSENRQNDKLLHIKRKVWLHRNNSEERVRMFGGKYSGLECDIYYHSDTDLFNVDHDDAVRGVTLADILKVLPKNEKNYLWLDFKNLSSESSAAALKKLNVLIKEFGLKKCNIVVESRVISALMPFAQAGYITSYYFEPFEGEENRLDLLHQRQREFYASGVTAVSSNLLNYDLLLELYPDIPHLFWDMKSYNRSLLTYLGTMLRVYLIEFDENVSVLLVGDRENRV